MLIIGIVGGTGSGKTTVVNKIVKSISENSVAVLAQDAYYKDNKELTFEERQKISEKTEETYNKGVDAYTLETEEKNQEKSINKWREIFGDDFPEYY